MVLSLHRYQFTQKFSIGDIGLAYGLSSVDFTLALVELVYQLTQDNVDKLCPVSSVKST